jgi:hypothetical protein
MCDSSNSLVSFYDQMSFVLSSLPISQWLKAGLHHKCVLEDGSAVIDEVVHGYLMFLSQLSSPSVLNVPIFFADSFKSLVLELLNIMFSVNDVDFSAFTGDILCHLLQGGSATAEITGDSVAKMFLLGLDAPRDPSTLNLLKQFAFWRRQSTTSPAFQFSPLIQADYQSEHPYAQDDCVHQVTFPSEVQHMDIAFDARSQTTSGDKLRFSASNSSVGEQKLLCFSGTQFTKHEDLHSNTNSILLDGNELTATFDCEDANFEEGQKLWGYKFTVSGFSVARRIRQSIQAVCNHLNVLFKDLLMLVCSHGKNFSFPLEIFESDILVVEASLVLSKLLSDVQVRSSLELIFLEEFSGKNVSRGFINLFQHTIKFASLNNQSDPPAVVCGKCPSGHFFELINGIPLESNYMGGWSCDVCRNSMSRAESGVWHCSTCRFDVCPGCQPVFMERYNSEFHIGDTVHLVPPDIADFRSFSDASSGPMRLGNEYSIRDVRPPHVNVEGKLNLKIYCPRFASCFA